MYTILFSVSGVFFGVCLFLFGFFIETHAHFSGDFLAAQRGSPVLWVFDLLPLVSGFAGMILGRQKDALKQLERSSKLGFSATADDLSAAAQSLLNTVQSFSAMTAETAASVKETTQTMSGLSHTAMQAALTAETVIGLAQQSRKSSEDGLQAVEVTCAGMAKVAEEVRALSSRIDSLNSRMRDILTITGVVGSIADRSERLAVRAETESQNAGTSASGFVEVARELREHAVDARSATSRVQMILGEVHKAMLATLTAVEMGSRRAESGAEVAAGTGETIRKLAGMIRESSEAAKQIATVAQQQDRGFDEVLKAMNEIYRAVEEGVAATQKVAQEARALNEIAQVIKEQVHGRQRAGE